MLGSEWFSSAYVASSVSIHGIFRRKFSKVKMSARSFQQGYWWPLYTTEWYAPIVSQPVFDPFSLTHVLHGFVMQLVLGRFINYWQGGLAIATGIEASWELFENSDFVVEVVVLWLETTNNNNNNKTW